MRPRPEPKPASVAQAMPGNRTRLDPSVVDDVRAFILCMASKYKTGSRLTTTGLKGKPLESRRQYVRWCKQALAAIREVAANLSETVHRPDFEEERKSGISLAAFRRFTLRVAHIHPTIPAPATGA